MAWVENASPDDTGVADADEMAAVRLRRDMLAWRLLEADSAGATPEPEQPSGEDPLPPPCARHGDNEDPEEGCGDCQRWTAAMDLRERLLQNIYDEGHDDFSNRFEGQDFALCQPEALSALGDLDARLQEASSKSEARRRELGEWFESLQTKRFDSTDTEDASGGAPVEDEDDQELLVALPPDFEDLVDLNAQICESKRQSLTASRPSTGEKKTSAGAKEEAMIMPAFLEKYFCEDKAAQQLPHRRWAIEEGEEAPPAALKRPKPKPKPKKDKENPVVKGFRQIAKLDGLLTKREAEATARLTLATVELEAAKEMLRKEAERIDREKKSVLERLKEAGLIRGSAAGSSVPSGRASAKSSECTVAIPRKRGAAGAASTADSSSVSSPRSSASCAAGMSEALVPVSVPVHDELVPMDWGGWTSTGVSEPRGAAGAVPAALAPPPAGEPRADSRHDVEDDRDGGDAGTFLTAATPSGAALARARAAAGRTSLAGLRGETQLAVVQEGAPADEEGRDDGADLESIGAGQLGDQDEVWQEGFGAEQSAVEAMQRIDERLRKLVPEDEWDSKSLSSYTMGSIADGSAAPSVLSRAESSAPADPALLARFEAREGEMALARVDDRIRDLQVLSIGDMPAVGEADIRRLLMQAAHEQEPADAASKVLALTAHGGDGNGGALAALGAVVQVEVAGSPFPENPALQEARQILNRLRDEDQEAEWGDALVGAEGAMAELEEEVRNMPTLKRADDEGGDDESPPSLLAPFAGRLEDLRGDASEIMERKSRAEELLRQLKEEDARADELESQIELDGDSLPNEDEGLWDVDHAFAEGQWQPRPLSSGPDRSLLRALNIDLPSGDGLWDDGDLERIVQGMNKHFGNAPAPVDNAAAVPADEASISPCLGDGSG